MGRKVKKGPREQSELFPNLTSPEFWASALVLAAVFFRPLVSGVAYSWSNAYFQTAVVLGSALILLMYLNGRRGLYPARAGVFLAGFLLWAGISTVFSVYRAASLRELYNFCGYAALFFLAANLCRAPGKKEAVLGWLYASAALVSLYAVYQYFWGLERTREAVGLMDDIEFIPEFMSRLMTQRAFSTFVYPPALAGFLTAVIPGVFGMMPAVKKRLNKALLAGCGVLCVFALFLTYSKGGWVAAVASGLFFLWGWMKYIRGRINRPAVLAAGLAVILMSAAVLSGVDRRATARGFTASYKVRYMYWRAAPGMIGDFPIAGSGPGTWGAVYPEYKPLEAEETQMAHNNYVQVAAETGIIGLFLLVFFFASSAAPAFRALRGGGASRGEGFVRVGLLSGLVAFWVQSLGEFTLYIPGAAAVVFLYAGLLQADDRGWRRAALSPRGRLFASSAVIVLAALLVSVFRVPMRGDRYYERGVNRLEKSDFPAADRLLTRAADAFPAEARYYFRRGLLREARPGFLSAAISDYEEAARLNPHSSAVNSRLASALWTRSGGRDNQDRERAIFFMEEAVRRYPFSPMYRLMLGRMYHLAGMFEEARREYLLAFEYERAEQMRTRRETLEERLEDVREWLEELGGRGVR